MMNRPALVRKLDRELTVWLLMETLAGWVAAMFYGAHTYWLWPGTFILLGSAALLLLDKPGSRGIWKARSYPMLFGMACLTGQIWSVFHSLTAVLLHTVTVLMMAALFLRRPLLRALVFFYIAGPLFFLMMNYDASALDFDGPSVGLSILLTLLAVYLIFRQDSMFRESAAQIRVTERNNHLERLGKQQHLATIGQIAASIAHDIRNPLTSIQGFIQLIERQERRASYLEYYGIIRSEIARIDTLIREVLTLSKSHTIEMEMLEKVDLADLLKRLVTLMEPDSLRCNVQVELELNQTPIVMGSDEKLQQVFLNILRNAFEAVIEHGKIEILLTERSGTAVVSIRDSGPGIPENKLGYLFTPFYTTKEEGTGLGLSICQSIVKAYGGCIEVRNLPVQGAEFTVKLPSVPGFNTGTLEEHNRVKAV